MKKHTNAFIIVGVIVILISCLSPYEGDNLVLFGLPGSGTQITLSDLFTQPDHLNANVYRFYTNDTKYRTTTGYTLWTYCSDPVTFQERIVTVRKPVGSSSAGYGVVICADQRLVVDRMETVFLTVMINNNRQYAIGKVFNAVYKQLVNWTDGAGLIKGTGLSHKIKITKDTGNPNKYDLYFNDVFECSFVDEEAPRCEGAGRNGYVVVIAQDDLYSSGVEVWFTENL